MSKGNWKDEEITLKNEKSLIYIYMHVYMLWRRPSSNLPGSICIPKPTWKTQYIPLLVSQEPNPQNTKQSIYSRFGYGSKLSTPIKNWSTKRISLVPKSDKKRYSNNLGPKYLCDPKKTLNFWIQRSHHSPWWGFWQWGRYHFPSGSVWKSLNISCILNYI